MSILIRGMEMPYGCADCDFCGGIIMPDGIYCCDCPTEASHGKNISDAINNDARADFCPLVEIPTPHGRLIDADELKSKFRHGKGNNDADSAWISTIRRFITQAETAIEAEGETDGR